MRNFSKKSLAVILTLVMLLAAVPFNSLEGVNLPFGMDAKAAEANSGTCGDNLTWTFDAETGVLEISGSGEMYDYYSAISAPWDKFKSSITEIFISDGVTSIGESAFRQCEELLCVKISKSVKIIDLLAFDYCSKLESVYFAGDLSDWCGIDFKSDTSNPVYYAKKLYINEKPVKNIVIPTSITNIKDYTFVNCTELESVYIPDSVNFIGREAFAGCDNLINVTIPNSVTDIGYAAFGDCTKLKNITFGNNLKCIGSYAFAHCNALEEVEISDSVVSIGESAFELCLDLTKTHIGSNVESIGNRAFYGCEKLQNITIPDGVTSIGTYAFYECCGQEDLIIPDSVEFIGEKTFGYCKKLKNVYIGSGVKEIGALAFFSGSLDKITVEKNNQYYFSDEYGVLYNYAKTKLIQYPLGNTRGEYNVANGVKEISDYAFSQSDLTSISLPDGIETIGDHAFEYSRITSVSIPDSVTSIGYSAFQKCGNLTTVEIGDGVTEINDSAFYNCNKLGNVTMGKSIRHIGDLAFRECEELKCVYFTGDISQWCQIYFTSSDSNPMCYAENIYFDNKVPKDITISSDIETINNYAFFNWKELENVTIHDGVESIGEAAFWGCSSLENVYFIGSESRWKAISIGDSNEDLLNANIHYNYNGANVVDSGMCGDNLTWILYDNGELVISGTGEMTYLNSVVPWASYSHDIKTVNIASGVTTIGNYAFYACTALTSVTIPDSVKTIGDLAFTGCNNLTSVIIPDSTTTIGVRAFNGCTNLTSITIGNSVTTIGDYAFPYCNNLISITIPDSVKTIGYDAFAYCSNLTSINVDVNNQNYSSDSYGVLFNKDKTTLIQYPIGNARTSYTIPQSATAISNAAFSTCTGLTSVTIGNIVTTIGNYAFSGCTGLTSVTIPDSVKTIGDFAFAGCNNLTSVTIGKGVTTIGDCAFTICTSITSIIIPDSVVTIGEEAFYGCSALEYIHIPTGVKEIGEYLLGDSSTYICSTTQDCYAKTYADENGIEFRVCKGHGADEPEVIAKESSNGNGIKVEYDSSYFENNDEIKLIAKEVDYADSNFAEYDENKKAIKHYDIYFEKDNAPIKCDKASAEFTVRIPVPSGYEHYVKFLITHWITDVNGKETCETLNGIVEDGYIVFKTKSFSEFDVCLFGFAQESLELTYKSTASFDVIKGTGFKVECTSSNPKVVTVDENGNITTQGRGSATITCTITDDYGNTVTDTCEVTVKFTFWQWIIYILFLGFLWY